MEREGIALRKTVLYIAVSLNGYIADQSGGVAWLNQLPAQEEDGYPEFIAQVDTIIMGAATYGQIVTELSPGEWPYQEQKTYVLTHQPGRADEENHIIFTSCPPGHLVEQLKEQKGKNIWICGGAQTARQFIRAGLVEEYRLTIAPVLLGKGIPLFEEDGPQKQLSLKKVIQRGPLVELIYSANI